MRAARRRQGQQRQLKYERRRVELGRLPSKVVVVADSHGRMTPETAALIRDQVPSVILHAGDLGSLEVLDSLSEIATTVVVRGNIDPRSSGLPDVVDVDLVSADGATLRALLVHIGLARTRLQPAIRRMAAEHEAQLVVCGHSHVPWMGRDGELTVLNPGSIGPRRFSLPVTFAVIEIAASGANLWHVDCATGARWQPSASA